jgi:hypothetical protein
MVRGKLRSCNGTAAIHACGNLRLHICKKYPVMKVPQQPLANDLNAMKRANMLGCIFAGSPSSIVPPVVLNEETSTMPELNAAINKLKLGKGTDETGLTAELLKHSPPDFRMHLLRLFNDVLLGAHVFVLAM